MYNYFLYANIIFVLTLVIVIFCVIIFPIFINFDIYFNLDYKKLYYKISLFGFVKVISSYVEINDQGILIHLTKRKAILIPFYNLLDMKQKVKPIKDYHLIKFYSLLELGNKTDAVLALNICFLYNYFSNFIEWYFYHKKPYFKLINNSLFYEDKSVLNISIDATITFNLLMIFISIIKILVEKIFYANRNKTEQNQ